MLRALYYFISPHKDIRAGCCYSISFTLCCCSKAHAIPTRVQVRSNSYDHSGLLCLQEPIRYCFRSTYFGQVSISFSSIRQTRNETSLEYNKFRPLVLHALWNNLTPVAFTMSTHYIQRDTLQYYYISFGLSQT